ncbi:MAG: exodeoxyribonuclease VII large subunit, partial [Proteobacteria bacterium]|nr:exodeoxyribonuclease VII large subunit [Pseudomonadota bacterium]
MNFPESSAPNGLTGAAATREVVSVSWLNRAAREALEGSFPLMWIAGEVSTLTRAASGHLYFTLKDEQAQVRCTMWRNRAQTLPFKVEHGMRVEVRALVVLAGQEAVVVVADPRPLGAREGVGRLDDAALEDVLD